MHRLYRADNMIRTKRFNMRIAITLIGGAIVAAALVWNTTPSDTVDGEVCATPEEVALLSYADDPGEPVYTGIDFSTPEWQRYFDLDKKSDDIKPKLGAVQDKEGIDLQALPGPDGKQPQYLPTPQAQRAPHVIGKPLYYQDWFGIWRRHKGGTGGQNVCGMKEVPEPSMLSLVLSGIMALGSIVYLIRS